MIYSRDTPFWSGTLELWIYEIHFPWITYVIYIISLVHPSVICGKNLNLGHYLQTFEPNSFMHAVLMPCFQAPVTSTILNYIQWSSLQLKVIRSAESKTRWLHFLKHFSSGHDEMWYGVEAIESERFGSLDCGLFIQGTQLQLFWLCQKL